MITNIKRISQFALVLCLLALTSCDDFLEVQPKSSWDTENFYKSEQEVKMALSGIYSYFASDNVYGSAIINFDSGTDEGIYNRRYSDGWPVGLYRHTPADVTIENYWTNLYSAINMCNMFVANIGNGDFTDAERQQYEAEARFLRGFAYFQLVRWFGDVPMPLMYTTELSANAMAATPTLEVYAQIEKDLKFASQHLLHPSDAEFEQGRAHNMAAHGLLARMYITMAGYPVLDDSKYQLVMDQCDTIFNDGFHQLTMNSDTTGYRELFLSYIQDNYNVKESMFEISFAYLREQGIQTHGRHGNMNGLSFGYGGTENGYPQAYAMLTPTPIIALTYTDEADRRKEWNSPGMKYSKEGELSRSKELSRDFCPGKFRRWEPLNYDDLDIKMTTGQPEPYVLLEKTATPTKNFTPINFPILRFADILLMYAEASNRVNHAPTAKGIECLNLVRARAGLADITTAAPLAIASEDAFFTELVDERLREFCFEGMRKMDLIRWELLDDKMVFLDAAIRGNSEFKETNADHVAFLRPSTYFNAAQHLSLPYPLQEVQINSLLEQKEEWK